MLYQLSYLGILSTSPQSPLMVSGLAAFNHFVGSHASVTRRMLYQLSYLGNFFNSLRSPFILRVGRG